MFAEVISDGQGGLTYRNLAGSSSEGLPLGTIIAIHRTTVPNGFLPCNGATFDITQYPSLYLMLGSNTLPDLRECNLVGIGQSTRVAITNHDVYTLGQFKDDQMQQLPAAVLSNGDGGDAVGVIYGDVAGSTPNIVRNGLTTHGKNYGINYVIKAVTGNIDVDDAEVYDEIVGYLQEHYPITDLENIYNGALVQYDSENNKYVPVVKPTVSNSALTATVDTDIVWTKDSLTFYDNTMTEVTEPEGTLASTISIGKADSNWVTITGINKTNTWEFNSNFYDNVGNTMTEPDGSVTDTNIIGQAVIYNSAFYTKEDTSWYSVFGFNKGTIIKDEIVTDAAIITALDALTLADVEYKEYTDTSYGLVTGFTSTGFITTTTALSYDSATAVDVYCKEYAGLDFAYSWSSSASGTGIAFIGTRAQYEAAKLIPEGQSGFIPSGAAVIITDETDTEIYGEDA